MSEEVTVGKERKRVRKRGGGRTTQVFVIPISPVLVSKEKREEKLASRKLTCNVRHFWLARFDNLGEGGGERVEWGRI